MKVLQGPGSKLQTYSAQERERERDQLEARKTVLLAIQAVSIEMHGRLHITTSTRSSSFICGLHNDPYTSRDRNYNVVWEDV